MTQIKTDHIKALAKVQKDLKHAKKDEKGAFGKYADLASVYDAIKKPLTDNGFAYTHEMTSSEDGTLSFVDTFLVHESGGIFKTRIPAINRKGDMPGLGSAITYGKRYGISMIVGLASEEDDDGRGASGNKPNASNPISNILIYNSKGEFAKAPNLSGAITKLDMMLAQQIKKYEGEELKDCGSKMRENNKALLERIKNHEGFIENGYNERFAQIDKKLKEMENTKDE